MLSSARNSISFEHIHQISAAIASIDDEVCSGRANRETSETEQIEDAVSCKASDMADERHPRRSPYQQTRETVTRFGPWEAAALMIQTVPVNPFLQLLFALSSRLVGGQSQQAIFQRIYDWDVAPTLGADAPLMPSQRMWVSISQGFVTECAEA